MILIKILLTLVASEICYTHDAINKKVPTDIEKQISAHWQWEDYYYESEQDKNYNINTNKVR